MLVHAPAETVASHGCRLVSRWIEGPLAREGFLLCEPVSLAGADFEAQSEAVYAAIVGALEDAGASIVTETVFLMSTERDLAPLRAARARVLGGAGPGFDRPATSVIEQPPLAPEARLAIAIHAVAPLAGHRGAPAREPVQVTPRCPCAACAESQAVRLRLGETIRLHAGGLGGVGSDAYRETLALFERAGELLAAAGMEFRDVVRTWIHLRDIDRDYEALNRGRREFFAAHGVDPLPASTGIGGAPASPDHDVALGFEAIQGDGFFGRAVMHAPTLNEAPEYGADFARGLRVEETNRVTLHVSGTASVDEAGRTAHPGDFDAQADRMLVNVAALLEEQGAGFGDVVSAITYVKDRADADRLRGRLAAAGFEGFPHALVEAHVCRADLLCETEAIAILPA